MTKHECVTERRPVMKKGYQDQMYESSESWMICSCGWERLMRGLDSYDDRQIQSRLLRLEHVAGLE